MRPASPRPRVVTLTEPLTRTTATRLTRAVGAAPPDAPVVVDLTAIPAFDSEGTQILLDLQRDLGTSRMTIVGMERATRRILHMSAEAAEAAGEAAMPLAISRLHNTVVVRPQPGTPVLGDQVEAAIDHALRSDVAVVVLDVRDASTVTPSALEAITFASSAAALRRCRLLVVNLRGADAAWLRSAGLSAATYVAPEPLP